MKKKPNARAEMPRNLIFPRAELVYLPVTPEVARAVENAVQMSLLGICASFARYFARGNVDPQKDMLLLTNCTLLLTDEEFSSFLSEINEIALKYMKAKATESSKTRQITLISAPTSEQVI